VRVVAVRGAAGGTQPRLGLFDAVPAPHADLVAAFARVELFVGEVELFAAEGADVVLWRSECERASVSEWAMRLPMNLSFPWDSFQFSLDISLRA
jgi:hypothetical protein